MNKMSQRDRSLTCVKDSYERAIKQKLTDITATRAKHANKVILQQMHNPQPIPLNMVQQPIQGVLPIQNEVPIAQGFSNHQLQHQMRASGMGMPTSVLPQQSQLPMGHPQMNLHQTQQKVNPQLLQHNGQPPLTTEENGIVSRIAHSMMQKTSEDQLNVYRNLIPPEKGRILQARGVDPAFVYFRTRAIAKFLENKAKLANQRTPSIPTSNNALMPQPVRPPAQNAVPDLGQQSSGQMFEPSYVAGNMNQILGQQREAMRSQEAGQVVVPASTGQIISDAQRGNIRAAPQQQPIVHLDDRLPSDQPSNAQYWSQNQNMQHSPHMRVSQQGSQFVHMPHGGLHNQQQMAPQNMSLPNINQATSPNSQNAWLPQKPSPISQSKDKELASPHFANMTANSSTSMTEEQKNAYVQRQMQLHQQRFVARQQQQKEALTKGSELENVDGKKLQIAAQTSQPSHLSSNNTIANNNNIQQPAVAQQPAPSTPGQALQMTPQERPTKTFTWNEVESLHMDNWNFPPTILNSSSGHYLSKLPPDLKTWGQLKSWAAQNERALPPVTLQKLRNLQVLHYKSLVDNSRKKAQIVQTQHLNTQGLPQASAPTAPMVPQQSHWPPLPIVNPPQPAVSVPQSIPKSTAQDIQVFRAQFSERFPHLNDAEIEGILIKQRQEQMRNHQRSTQQPGQLNNHPRNPNQRNVPPQFPLSANQASILQPPNLQRSHPDQNTRPSATVTAASTQIQTNRHVQQLPGHGTTNGVKRNSDNDIVEVAARKDTLTKSQISTEPRVNTSLNIQEHSAYAYDKQRHLQADHQRAASAHSVNQGTKGPNFDQRQVEAQKRERDSRFNQILAEAKQNIHRRQTIQMDAHTRSLAVQQLAAAKEHSHRVEVILPKFFNLTGDEGFVKRVIQAVWFIPIVCEQATDLFQIFSLSQQYSEKQDSKLADQFTLTFEEIKEHTHTIKQALTAIIQIVKSPADQPTGLRQISVVQETNESATATLSATNLHQHQLAIQNARQATFQKNISNRAPAAPTSRQPPFAFGAQSPQGLAKYPDKPNGLTQDKLSLPSTKRRKGTQVATTTAASAPAPGISKSAQANMSTISDAQPVAPASTIKCPLPNCHSGVKDFGTQIELDAHVSEVHGPKEPPIEDPLQWALQQARLGVGLDETGKSMPRPEQDVVRTPRIKASESEPAQHLKQESSSLTARVQTGRSPVFHLKTPQASAGIKTPSSEAKSSDMDGKIAEPHTSEKTFQKSLISSPDPWASSHIPPAVINHSWHGLPDVSFIGPWTTIQSALTPTSTQSSGKSEKNSPRISDISEQDAVKINLVVEDDSEWANILGNKIYGDMEAPNEAQDQLSMNWETAFGLEELAGSGETGIAAGVNELTIDNNDWMKIYAPERMDQSKG